MYVCVPCVFRDCGNHKKESDLLGLELSMVVICPVGDLICMVW